MLAHKAGMLALEKVEVSYGQVQALRAIDLRVEDGELVALLGANGAGKSTTLMAISGIVRPRAGSIAYLEKSVAQHRESGMRRETMRELERLAASYGEIGQADKAKAAVREAELLRAQMSTE